MIHPKSYTILLVEDDEDDFLLMKVYLGDSTVYQVLLEWVDTYEKALNYVELHPPDVLFVDYNLNSARNGLDLVWELKEKGADFPSFLLTAQEKETFSKNGAFAILDGYINKNHLTPKLLADTISPFLS